MTISFYLIFSPSVKPIIIIVYAHIYIYTSHTAENRAPMKMSVCRRTSHYANEIIMICLKSITVSYIGTIQRQRYLPIHIIILCYERTIRTIRRRRGRWTTTVQRAAMMFTAYNIISYYNTYRIWVFMFFFIFRRTRFLFLLTRQQDFYV